MDRRTAPRIMAVVALCLLSVVLIGCSAPINEVRMDRRVFLETTRTEKVLVDVRNSTGIEPFPLQPRIEQNLRAKGYTLVGLTEASKADVVVRVLIQYAGLEQPDFKGDRAASGGFLGAAGGAGVALAGKGRGGAVALGALAGAVIGAAAGALQEKMDSKEVFTSLVALRIGEVNKPVQETNVRVRLRQKDLTYKKAIDMVAERVARQVAGLF